MYELVVEHNGVEELVFAHEDRRVVELRRQRHARALAPGEASIREMDPKKLKK
ncbi:hypothetical protein [Pseudodesulfovibrio sp. zrk46]|uniref:hypothetical protein n=1 Tax=Pseudodesulfovibrio sp. zrk46 TaxID=2725288 RepID=UPI001449E67F|nr:hypothetical protein [Pseudodesulfovibrio sp. zrk46]QJB55894.1 hypothetical protein HFN16_05495 [Pseudodesulfovibrio sp. zrk46]